MTQPPVDTQAATVLEVLAPGLLSTIQDLGRPGLERFGVPSGGAADPLGLAVANLLVGNEPGLAALECTLLGPELRALRDVSVGIGGADLEARVLPGGRTLRPGGSHRLRAGEVLAFSAVEPDVGCRAYAAVPGGFEVPEVLGSRSTSLVGGFGGLDGRPLRAGDLLPGRVWKPAPSDVAWPADLELPSSSSAIRVLAGPDATAQLPGSRPDLPSQLVGTTWTIGHDSDRRGIRLEGQTLAATGPIADRPSSGVLPGAIQVTPSGQPIVLMPDAGPTGGYPVIAVVCAADLWRLGQLRPGSEVTFELVASADARTALVDRRRLLAAAAERLLGHLS